MIYIAKVSQHREFPDTVYKIGITTSDPGNEIDWRPELVPPRGILKNRGQDFYAHYRVKLNTLQRAEVLGMLPFDRDVVFLIQDSFWRESYEAFVDWWNACFGDTIVVWPDG